MSTQQILHQTRVVGMPAHSSRMVRHCGVRALLAALFGLFSAQIPCAISFQVPAATYLEASPGLRGSKGYVSGLAIEIRTSGSLGKFAIGSTITQRRSPLTTVHGWFGFNLGSKEEEAVQQPRPYDSEAEGSSWDEACEGITVEDVEGCGVVEAADYADILVAYMESCSRNRLRIPGNAAEVLTALLSHPAGAQGFWTSFLTDPDLVSSTKPSYDPALVEAIASFPELNLGVISSCLSMSATEEALYESDELLRANAQTSKERAFLLIDSITKQPNAKTGIHGLNWMLDLIDYVEMEEAMNMVEQRKAG